MYTEQGQHYHMQHLGLLSLLPFTHTHGPLDFVRDYLGEPVPEPIWILLNQDSEWQWYHGPYANLQHAPDR